MKLYYTLMMMNSILQSIITIKIKYLLLKLQMNNKKFKILNNKFKEMNGKMF